MEIEKKNWINLLNTEMFVPTAMCFISKIYLIAAALLHVVCIVLYMRSGMENLAVVSGLYIIAFLTCFFIFNNNRIRYIYMFVIFIIEMYIILHVHVFGWKYNFYIYSFMIVPLCILTSISPREKRYNIKYPIGFFLVTQGTLLVVRILDLIFKFEPMVTFSGKIDTMYRVEGIIVYVTSAVASFVPIFGFIIDINTAYARINKFNKDLKFSATHDALTNLINRRFIMGYIDKALEMFNKEEKVFSLILADIDNFKKINDTYGHNAGDIVLKGVSSIILETVEDKDYVCRWGGEEILILTNTSLDKAVKVAEEIRKNIEKTDFLAEKNKIKVTITQGVAQIERGISMDKLIETADNNLYKGKKTTKNCVISA